MVLTASAIKNIASTMTSIEGNLGIIASQIAGDKYKYQDEVTAAHTSLKNAMKTCQSAKNTVLSKALLTPEHLIEAAADKSQLFDKMVSRIISLEARATVLANILENTYETAPESEVPAEEVEACGDMSAEDGVESEVPAEVEACGDEECEDDFEVESEEEEELDLDAEEDDFSDEELGLGDEDEEEEIDLESSEDEDEEDDTEIKASAKKPQSGQSRNALMRKMVKASAKPLTASASMWEFK